VRAKTVGCIIIALAIIGCTSKSGEITVYSLWCEKPLQNAECRGKLSTSNPTVYRISEERQLVIYWTPGISDSPSKLSKCVVRDVENWQCSYPDDSADLYMEDGQFRVHANENIWFDTKQTLYVSWLQYWKLKLTRLFSYWFS